MCHSKLANHFDLTTANLVHYLSFLYRLHTNIGMLIASCSQHNSQMNNIITKTKIDVENLKKNPNYILDIAIPILLAPVTT
jgi:hypothetical protein